ncbi:hypothetical protein D9M72_518370 [compost metagenome]
MLGDGRGGREGRRRHPGRLQLSQEPADLPCQGHHRKRRDRRDSLDARHSCGRFHGRRQRSVGLAPEPGQRRRRACRYWQPHHRLHAPPRRPDQIGTGRDHHPDSGTPDRAGLERDPRRRGRRHHPRLRALRKRRDRQLRGKLDRHGPQDAARFRDLRLQGQHRLHPGTAERDPPLQDRRRYPHPRLPHHLGRARAPALRRLLRRPRPPDRLQRSEVDRGQRVPASDRQGQIAVDRFP